MKTVRKLFGVWNYEQEENWLNTMAAEGWELVGVKLWKYEFAPCEPGAYTYRLEMLENWHSHRESQAYVQFVEETGTELVCTFGRWVYFRHQNTEESPRFELFSDTASRIKHLDRICLFLVPLILVNLFNFYPNLWFLTGEGNAFYGFRLWISILQIGAILLLTSGLWKIWSKRQRLARERDLQE